MRVALNVINASVDYSSSINAPHEYFDDTARLGALIPLTRFALYVTRIYRARQNAWFGRRT
jgi:hypothetical protein